MTKISPLKPDFQKASLINSGKLTDFKNISSCFRQICRTIRRLKSYTITGFAVEYDHHFQIQQRGHKEATEKVLRLFKVTPRHNSVYKYKPPCESHHSYERLWRSFLRRISNKSIQLWQTQKGGGGGNLLKCLDKQCVIWSHKWCQNVNSFL